MAVITKFFFNEEELITYVHDTPNFLYKVWIFYFTEFSSIHSPPSHTLQTTVTMQQNSLVYCFLIVLTLLPEQGVKFVWSAGVDTTADVIEIEGAESGVIHGKGYGYGYGRKRYVRITLNIILIKLCQILIFVYLPGSPKISLQLRSEQ